MLLVAYLSLFGTIIWLLRVEDHDRILIRRPRLASLIRIATSLMAVSFLVLGAFLVVDQPSGHTEVDPVRIAFAGALIGGSALYLQGVALWRAKGAYRLRVVGWCLIAAVLSVPSTLTLALPVVATMAVVLVEVTEASRRGAIAQPGAIP